MTKSDYNKLGIEKQRGPMNELVGIRYDLIDTATTKVEAAALAMDHVVISEMAKSMSLQAPTGPELLHTEDPAAFQASSKVVNAVGTFPLQQMVQESNMLTGDEPADAPYLDAMAAEARVEQAYADNDTRSSYDDAAA